jgi:hypothetical protein
MFHKHTTMKIQTSIVTCFILLITLASCDSSKMADKKSDASAQLDPERWENRPYEVSELVMMFQNWVPDEYLNGKFVWLSMNLEWEKFKQTDHTKIKPGNYNIVRNDSSITPANYLATIVGTIDDRAFFTDEWFKNAGSWEETMLVNYSDEKCAD